MSNFKNLATESECLDKLVTDEPTTEIANDAGQATVEYALVLLGAALIALLLIGWATVGGGAARIGQFLGHVFDIIERKVA
jgi:Flp pilus assembly pilin Flp